MRLSEDRISHIGHLISERIWQDDLVDYTDDVRALKLIKKTIKDFLEKEDVADLKARDRISSLSKDIPEGSQEWETLYKKYRDEVLGKLNF